MEKEGRREERRKEGGRKERRKEGGGEGEVVLDNLMMMVNQLPVPVGKAGRRK